MFYLNVYQRVAREFKDLCNEKKRQYSQNIVDDFCNARDSASFWKLAKEMNCKAKGLSPVVDANNFRVHFNDLLNPAIAEITYFGPYPLVEIPELDNPVTDTELVWALRRSKDGKAAGINRIPSEFYKYGPESLKGSLLTAFNHLFDSGRLPEEYNKAIIFPLHKKGDKKEVTNYRGISFLNASLKLFTSIMHERLLSWVENNNLLSPFQAGFRRGYSTIDQIFNLMSISQIFIENGTKLYLFFVDFKTAFDHIQRDLLFYKLAQKGISTKFLNMVKALYKNTSALVWNGQNFSDDFDTNFGIKQGCNISPLLFSIFIDDLNEVLKGGVKIGNTVIKL